MFRSALRQSTRFAGAFSVGRVVAVRFPQNRIFKSPICTWIQFPSSGKVVSMGQLGRDSI